MSWVILLKPKLKSCPRLELFGHTCCTGITILQSPFNRVMPHKKIITRVNIIGLISPFNASVLFPGKLFLKFCLSLILCDIKELYMCKFWKGLACQIFIFLSFRALPTGVFYPGKKAPQSSILAQSSKG